MRMNAKHRLLLASVGAVAILASGSLAAQNTFAAESTTPSPLSSLIEKIAAKFNLSQAEVQAVFDEDRTAREAEIRQELREKTEAGLNQALTDGELTQAQKDLITAKLAELETRTEEVRKIEDVEDRKAAMDQLRADLSKWAAENTIDSHWLHFGFIKKGGAEFRAGHGRKDIFIKALPLDTPTNMN